MQVYLSCHDRLLVRFLTIISFMAFLGTAYPQSLIQKYSDRAESTQKLDTLAMVGGEPITSADFLNRFELSIYPGKDDPTTLEHVKRGFLYSMIAEDLLSQEAARSDLPYTPAEDLVRKEMQDIFMRDALFRREIMPRAKAAVTNDDMLHGFKISVYTYLVDAFYFESDSAKAWSFWAALSEKKSPDIYSLAASIDVSHDTLEIPYGESTAAIENAFFGHRVGFISKPTVTVDGLVVFKVIGKMLNKKFVDGSIIDRLHRIRQILVNREEIDLGNKYVEEVMRHIEVDVNYKVFRPLVYAIQKIFEKERPTSYDPYYSLTPQQLALLSNDFSSKLAEPLLTFKGGSITLADAFDQLPTAMFAAEDSTLPAITFALHMSLRFISQNHFLVQRARELGLANSNEVNYNVRMVLNAFRSYRVANEITDTVRITQAEVDTFFTSHHDLVLKSVKLRLRAYEADDINQALAIYNGLENRKDLKAAEADTAARWVDAFQLGETGAVLSELKRGQIYGPIEDHGKFYIYQLLDKRSTIGNEAIRNSIEVARELLLEKEKSETLSRYIAHLAENDGVRLFKKNLLELRVTPFQMLTYRLIGFGGRILAVPQLYPREGWIKYYNQKRPPVP